MLINFARKSNDAFMRSIAMIIMIPIFIATGGLQNKINAQIITTVAGNGLAGFSGDGTPATAATLYNPIGVLIEKNGNLIFTDIDNNRVRKVDGTGIINTFAGTGTAGFSGDGLLATNAEINTARGVATDNAGNVYVADYNNGRVRKITPSGIITTIAGVGPGTYSGDGLPATLVRITPNDIAFDLIGNMYIADPVNIRVFKVSSGIINTFAGNGISGYSGDGLPATAANMKGPTGIALDGKGNLYIADWLSDVIRKVDLYGTITTFAGTGVLGHSGDGMPATAAELGHPQFVATDACGNVYISDMGAAYIRRVDPSGIITSIAGNGTGGYSGDGGPATAAELSSPYGIKVDSSLNIYFADCFNNVVRKISTSNHPPMFASGHVRSVTICEDSLTVSLDTMLRAADVDSLQTETWSLLKNPAHGTAMAAYSTTSTGGTITPAGLSYSHAIGYTGNDTFKVRVADCGSMADTVTFYVSILDCSLGVAVSARHPLLEVSPNPGQGSFTVNVCSTNKQETHLIVTNMAGERIKSLTMQTNEPYNLELKVSPGVYLISAISDGFTLTQKIVIQ